jgi:5-methylcytosine-specific restriction endonuclease McrA
MKKNATKRISKIPSKRVSKTRCANTMTESAFWSFIRSALRQKSRFWKPITECKLQARRLYKGTNKRQKYEYQCNACKNWFIEKKINVDHIKPAGSLNSAQDLPGFVERLFCEVSGLQVLCEKCHDKKTKADKNEKDNS